jgi:3-phenylpropionate/trans-cinnamate dioxygenase ferredoxin subunit
VAVSNREEWTRLGPASDVPPGTMKDYRVDEKRSVLVANCEGRLYAIEDRCTHDDGPLAEGELIDDCRVECPRHGALFDLQTGKALTLPAVRPVASFPVRVTDCGDIEADLAVEPPAPPRPRRDRFGRR